ncbi:thioredoxin family protein [Caenimonas aquaedulcis]|uniref:Thioredoxin fold domain-containing protein n=1 Tax=Caenimonas aquaedulcis TaxID=2793270 RepID=A0A931MHU0_9BURK|nr:thioredoxin fold domain-containing protein [Caenimonas aquaedulcis]
MSSDAEVDKAFDLGRRSGKPIFLYWGAVWCPPCNQVKATLFSRADFVERSRAFVPVYVDGDKPGAQKVAARFKVQGYPTMILFKADGTEVTRLPGEVDPQRYLLTLTAGLDAQVPAKELLQRVSAKQALTPEQWRLLAFYSWETDEQQTIPAPDLPKRLDELATAVPADVPQVRERLRFKALSAAAEGAGSTGATAPEREAGRKFVDQILSDSEACARMADMLIAQGETIVKYLAPAGAARQLLASKWDSALAGLSAKMALSKADQVDALDARVGLWKMIDGTDTLAAARQPQVLTEIAALVAATKDRYERQAVVPAAAHVLASAGLFEQSDGLLKAELPRAVAPYYHMLGLAGNAKKRNDAKSALDWYEQAWRKSEGPATRIQWGTGYVGQLLELAPQDASRIKTAASAVIAQLEPKAETFYERNQRSLQRMALKLDKWHGSDANRVAAVDQLRRQLAATCARLPAKDAGRANCEAVFSKTAS